MNLRQRLFKWPFLLVMPTVSIAAAELETRQVRLCTLSDETIKGSISISPDCKRVAFANQDDSGTWMVLDGVPLKKYPGIAASRHLCRFSPDGKRLAYVAGAPDGVKSIVVVDGQEWRPVERLVQTNELLFSPESKRLAVVCGEGELSFLMVDGTNGPSYQALGAPKFSPDGQRLAYVATPRTGKHMLVVDGNAGAEYDSISGPVFSPDSKHLACVCGRNGKQMVVVDEQDKTDWPCPLFSPDGKRLVYFAGTTNRWRLVEETLEGVQWRFVDDKVHGEEWEIMGRPRFSPDSKHLAFCAGRGLRQYAVHDGTIREFEGRLLSVGAELSSDGTRFAHILVREKNRICVVEKGVPGEHYEHILTQEDGKNLFFSPDSKHLAYIAERNYNYLVVRDGIEGKPCYNVTALRFSPDSKHLGYQADLSGGGRRALVIDGTAADIKPSERIISDWCWANANTACVAVIRGREILRLEVTVR